MGKPMTTPTDTRAEGEAMLEHLRHMAEVRPQGLDRDAAEWALERIASLSAQLAEAQAYATRLATTLWEKHWKQDAPEWLPLPELIGVLTQIDNSCAGLVRSEALAEAQRKIEQYETQPSVTWVGLVSFNKIANWLAQHDFGYELLDLDIARRNKAFVSASSLIAALSPRNADARPKPETGE